jgi:hypothetical protein
MESERELLSEHLGVGLVDLNHWRGREGINTPSGPNDRISAALLHLTRSTVAPAKTAKVKI